MAQFENGNKLATGRPKGSKNRLTNDVRECFHRVFAEMGESQKGEDGKPLTGHQAFLMWARENQTEFYRLYGKMIPQTAELPGDLHEDFVDTLIFAEEQARLIEGNAKVVDITEMGNEAKKQDGNGEEDGKQASNGEKSTDNAPSDS